MTRTPAEPLADDEMIEKVARAIYDECRILEQEEHGGDIQSPWTTLDTKQHEQMKRVARAAITAYNPNDRLSRITTLFDAIQHGDEAHRAWLKEAIDKHFAGEAVPAPKGKGNSERLREALVALADAADKCTEAPHFIVQPFLNVYRKHGETIAEARRSPIS